MVERYELCACGHRYDQHVPEMTPACTTGGCGCAEFVRPVELTATKIERLTKTQRAVLSKMAHGNVWLWPLKGAYRMGADRVSRKTAVALLNAGLIERKQTDRGTGGLGASLEARLAIRMNSDTVPGLSSHDLGE